MDIPVEPTYEREEREDSPRPVPEAVENLNQALERDAAPTPTAPSPGAGLEPTEEQGKPATPVPEAVEDLNESLSAESLNESQRREFETELLHSDQRTLANMQEERFDPFADAMGKMDAAREIGAKPEDAGLADAAEKAGLTPEEAAHWRKNDPEYLRGQTVGNQVLQKVGPDGYTARQMQDPDKANILMDDAPTFADIESGIGDSGLLPVGAGRRNAQVSGGYVVDLDAIMSGRGGLAVRATPEEMEEEAPPADWREQFALTDEELAELPEPERERYLASLANYEEAERLGRDGTALERAWYDLKTGFGQVGTFALQGVAGTYQMLADLEGDSPDYVADLGAIMEGRGGLAEKETPEAAAARREQLAVNIEAVREMIKDAESGWLGPAIDTGNPVLDWTRTAILQGMPFLAGSMALAAIPGVGAGGAAAAIGGGMGAETYGSLRADGVSPGIAAAAAGGTAVTSYLLNSIQLPRWQRNLAGKSPIGQFTAGALRETIEEGLSEAGESLGQGFFEATARSIDQPGYTREQWFRDMKDAALESFQEGAAAGALSIATRMMGAPRMVRNQTRAMQFDKSFKQTMNQVGETKLYQAGQDAVVADHLTQTAKHHGAGGLVFASAQDLQQSGLKKSEILEGLGVSEQDFDFARDHNVDLPVDYGHAAVFAKRQADAGNALFQDAFRPDPDAMSGREIAEQRVEMEAILNQAEADFAALRDEQAAEGKPGAPDRIQVFRAGLRAFGFDANESDAVSSLFWARAQRAGELYGETPEQWLDRKDVQLEMESTFRSDSRALKRYHQLTDEFRASRDAAEAARGEAVASEASAEKEWVDNAAREAVSNMGIEGDAAPEMAETLAEAMQEEIATPETRDIAQDLGVELPSRTERDRQEQEAQAQQARESEAHAAAARKGNVPEPESARLEQPDLSRLGDTERQGMVDELFQMSFSEIKIEPSLYRGIAANGDTPQEEGSTDITPSLYREQTAGGGITQTEGSISNVSIPVLKGDVKPTRVENDTLYTSEPDGTPRGAIRFPSSAGGPTVIKLFRNSDVSTVVHELNHLFVHDLQQMVAAGRGGERAKADLAALAEFAGGKLDRAGFEKIAQAWEEYTMEGQAPSPELYDAFETFRDYISRVYSQAVRREGVEASAEVRAVFDRFLATDQQIAEARRMEGGVERWYNYAASMDEAAKDRLRKAADKREDARRRRLDAARAGKALSRVGPENLNEIRARIRGEEANTPVYRAVSEAREAGGMSMAEVEAMIGRPAAEEIARRHGSDVVTSGEAGGADMQSVAEAAGYDSVSDMLAEMSGVQPVQDKVNADIRNELSREEEAAQVRDDAEGEPAAKEEIDIEEESLVAQVEESIKAGGGNARGLREFQVKRAAMKAAAEKFIGQKPLREAVDLRRFQKAKRDANRSAIHAARKGDMQAVAGHLQSELMHHLTLRAAMDARNLRDKVGRRYNSTRLQRTLEEGEHKPRIENEYAEAVKAVATFVGLTDSRKLMPQNPDADVIPFPTYDKDSTLAAFIPDIAGSVEPWLLNKHKPEGAADWKDFSVDQMREVDRVMQLLIKQGRGALDALGDLGARTVDELVAQSIATMERRPDRTKVKHDDRSTWGRALNFMEKFGISMEIPENWFMAMDGNPTIRGEDFGVNQRLFFKLRDAETSRDKLYKGLLKEMQPHIDQLEKARRDIEKQFGGKTFAIPGLEVPDVIQRGRNYRTWDADTLLSVALNMGNDANLYRLTGKHKDSLNVDTRPDAYNFTDSDLAKIARLFDADTWRAIQGVWDATGSLYGQLDDVTYRLTNRHVVKESAQPLTVRTSDGEVLALAGGYFPAVNDPLLSNSGQRTAEQNDLNAAIRSGVMDNIHHSAKPTTGAIKERLRDENGNPVVRTPQMLKTSILIRHLDAATHYITHAEAVKEFDALTRNEEWKDTYSRKFGEQKYRAVRRWVQDLANSRRPSNSVGEELMEKARTLATVSGLGLRIKTGLKQRLGYAQAVNYMSDASRTGSSGWRWMAVGLREMGVGGNIGGWNKGKIDFVNGVSDYMAARDGSHDRELRAQMEKLTPFSSSGKKRLNEFMFAWIQANDRAGAYATWLGAYKQAMSGNANFDIAELTEEQVHKKSVIYADSAAATQASSFRADLTENQRATGLMRFMSMFQSGNVRQGSRVMQYLDAQRLGDKSKFDVAFLAFREFAASALAWTFLGYGIQSMLGGGGDDDEEESIWTEAAWETLDNTVAPFPIVREIPSALRYRSGGRVPAVSEPARALQELKKADTNYHELKHLEALGNALRGFGILLKVPVMNPVDEAIRFAKDVGWTGKKRKDAEKASKLADRIADKLVQIEAAERVLEERRAAGEKTVMNEKSLNARRKELAALEEKLDGSVRSPNRFPIEAIDSLLYTPKGETQEEIKDRERTEAAQAILSQPKTNPTEPPPDKRAGKKGGKKAGKQPALEGKSIADLEANSDKISANIAKYESEAKVAHEAIEAAERMLDERRTAGKPVVKASQTLNARRNDLKKAQAGIERERKKLEEAMAKLQTLRGDYSGDSP